MSTPQTPARPPRPQPILGAYERPFWAAVQRRQLSLQQCGACAHIWYPPGPVCPRCLSDEWAWRPVAGTGRIIAWTVFRRQYFDEFPAPYVVISAALDEGPLLIGTLRDGVGPTLRLDQAVRIAYLPVRTGEREWLTYEWVLAGTEVGEPG